MVLLSNGISMDRTALRVARRFRAALVRQHEGAYVQERVLDEVVDRARRLIEVLLAGRRLDAPEVVVQLAGIVVEAECAERVIPF